MGWGRDGGNATYSYILPGSRQTTNPTLPVINTEKYVVHIDHDIVLRPNVLLPDTR